MDIAEKIKELNAQTDELVKSIEANREKIVKNNRLVRQLATQLKKTNEILGIEEPATGKHSNEVHPPSSFA